jgi:hypothetical protein
MHKYEQKEKSQFDPPKSCVIYRGGLINGESTINVSKRFILVIFERVAIVIIFCI